MEHRKVGEIRVQQELLVTTLEDRRRLAYMRYQGGVDSLLNALDADRDLFSAELSLAQTRRNELTALVGDPNVSIHEGKAFVCNVERA